MTNEERILEIGNDWYTLRKVSKEDRQLLLNEYFEATHKQIGMCATCFVKMYNYFKQKTMIKTEKESQSKCDYELHDKKVLWDGGKHISNANLTNEDAKRMLSKNKGAIAYFKKFPEDWKLQAGIKEEIIEEEIAKKNVKDTPYESEKRLQLKGKSLIELQEIAANLELPEEKWINLKAKPLTDYLVKNS